MCSPLGPDCWSPGPKGWFGPHAWSQAYVGGKWIGLDSRGNAMGYGSGHITLCTGSGDPENFSGVISTLGYFKITDVTINK